mgnify:CR=1 FL=1
MITIKENKKTKKKLKEEDKKLTYEILKGLNIGDTLSNEENIEKEEIKVNRKKILFLRKEFVYLFLVLFVIFGGYSGARILLWSNDARSTEKQIEKINNEVNVEEVKDTSETIIEDVPADNKGEYNEEVNSSDLTKDTSEFFGGSYTDANGKFVIVLTEDTPANRTAICKELGRSENNTTFVKGTYTLAYLTELQEKITNAMVNKEIPFVVTSGVYETANNIIIRVTTNDEAELAKVYALDTIGGAIKVEFSAGAVVEELLLPLPKAE